MKSKEASKQAGKAAACLFVQQPALLCAQRPPVAGQKLQAVGGGHLGVADLQLAGLRQQGARQAAQRLDLELYLERAALEESTLLRDLTVA